MRHKYVEERFPRCFIFGEYPDGHVDVSDVNHDVATHVTREEAQRVIAERDKIVDMMCRLTDALQEAAPEVLSRIWYG